MSVDGIPEADRFEDAPHPRESTEFFGHDETEKALLELHRSGRMPHACLIGGPPGIGKATLAWRLARFILANPHPTDSDGFFSSGLFVPREHPVSRQVVALSHPDLFLLRRNWNEKTKKLFTEIRVDDVRSAIRMFQQSSGRGGFRICLLDSAEDLNAESANALLKVIEEPPPRSLFLLVAHKPGRVLPTIRSRCHKISLKPLSDANIFRIVAALGSPWSDLDEETRRKMSSAAHGSVHGALRRLGTKGARLAAQLENMLNDLPRLDWHQIHTLADQASQRDNTQDFDLMLAAVFDWLDAEARRSVAAGQGASVERLAAYAGAWEKVACMARQVTTFNLDRRSFVLALFAELAEAARTASG